MLDDGDDLSGRLRGGHLDLPRMREGGLSAVFMSIWVDPRRYRGERAWRRARALIATVRTFVEGHPDEVSLCTSGDEVRAAFRAGRIGILMGVEGAHALGTREPRQARERTRWFYEQGVRYMTLTWSNDNAFAHSSGGRHRDEGLTDAGRELVAQMNELGMIVDVSHVSDASLRDVLGVTRRPVLASHSSARALADHPRNIDDAGIRAIAAGGGAVCANYYTQFLDADYRRARRRLERRHAEAFQAIRERLPKPQRGAALNALARELAPELVPPPIETLAAHIEHIVSVGGSGAACLGSDFDGVGELAGMADVSDLPGLRMALVRRELPLRAILGENVLRVLDAQHGNPVPTARPEGAASP